MMAPVLLLIAGLAAGVPGDSAPLTTQAAEQDFQAANERSLEGDFKGAAALYRSLIERGAEHPELHYNLGNAYAAQDLHVKAIISYERALRLHPAHEDARANLDAVRARLTSAAKIPPVEGEQDLALTDVMRPLLLPFPPTPVAWGLVLAQALMFILWGFARKSSDPRTQRNLLNGARWAAALALGLATITVGHALLQNESVALSQTLFELRQGPDARFDTSGKVLPGARLRVLEAEGNWSKVLQKDGTTGWAHAENIVTL